jgi:hypothetical protein
MRIPYPRAAGRVRKQGAQVRSLSPRTGFHFGNGGFDGLLVHADESDIQPVEVDDYSMIAARTRARMLQCQRLIRPEAPTLNPATDTEMAAIRRRAVRITDGRVSVTAANRRVPESRAALIASTREASIGSARVLKTMFSVIGHN